MEDRTITFRVPARWVRTILIVGVTALIVAPLTAVATHSFTDVPDSNTFHADIEWLKDSGVTRGCNPPANTEYCPDDNVTRGQMAAFMRRLAGDNQPPTVNADRLDGVDSSQFLRANTVTTSHGGGAWTPVHGDEPGSVERQATRVITQGFGTMYLPLDAPVAIGNTQYRVQSVEICYFTEFIDDATFGTVGNLSLVETSESAAGSTVLWL